MSLSYWHFSGYVIMFAQQNRLSLRLLQLRATTMMPLLFFALFCKLKQLFLGGNAASLKATASPAVGTE